MPPELLTLTMLGPAGPAGPAGANGAAGPNEVTSATLSDGTADLSVSNITINSDGTNLGAFDIASGMFGIQMGTGDLYATLSSSNWYGTTFTGSHIQNLGTTDAPTFANLSLASGTITTSQPLSLTQTWNAAGVTFTGLLVNATVANAASTSKLIDLQEGGTTRFSVTRSGQISAGIIYASFFAADGNFRINSTSAFGWTPSTNTSSAADTTLFRDGQANTIAQRNLGAAQEFRLYGTTNAGVTEYERLKLKYNSTTLSYQIGTEKGGTTTSARPLEFQTDGTTRMTIGATGGVSLPPGSFITIQNLSITQTGISFGDWNAVFGWSGGTSFAQNSSNEAPRINFGGTQILEIGGSTSSFPALKRSSAILQARLADDSGYTTIDAQHRLQGTAPASATAAGTAGDIRYDSDYIYICTATNTWKRAAIATWP